MNQPTDKNNVEKLIDSVMFDVSEAWVHGSPRRMIEVDRDRLEQAFSELLSAQSAIQRSEDDPLVVACRGLLQYWTRNLFNFQWEKADTHVKRINIALPSSEGAVEERMLPHDIRES